MVIICLAKQDLPLLGKVCLALNSLVKDCPEQLFVGLLLRIKALTCCFRSREPFLMKMLKSGLDSLRLIGHGQYWMICRSARLSFTV